MKRLGIYKGRGREEDVALPTSEGFACTGWDPAYHPDAPREPADLVNFGYVINVVEGPAERAATLKQAWDLACRLLVVSAQVLMSGRGGGFDAGGVWRRRADRARNLSKVLPVRRAEVVLSWKRAVESSRDGVVCLFLGTRF